MANNKTTTTEVNDGVKTLTVDAKFVMSSFERKDGMKQEYAELILIEPFKNEELKNLTLAAKWDVYDKFNRLIRSDRVFDCMKYYAKKALRNVPEVPVKVTIKPVSYKSKKTGMTVTYPAMYVDPTFVELEDEFPVEVVVKSPEDSNVFFMLACKALGIKFTPKEESDDADIGLVD